MTVKAEYLYVDLGEQTITAADMDVALDSTVGITAHTAKVGLNFAF
jgi:opacity protein-like surface antigen